MWLLCPALRPKRYFGKEKRRFFIYLFLMSPVCSIYIAERAKDISDQTPDNCAVPSESSLQTTKSFVMYTFT
jgi:hypothetical protein